MVKGKKNCIKRSSGKDIKSEPVLYGNKKNGMMYLIRINLALYCQTNILLQSLRIKYSNFKSILS